jgi:hypothetical protein
MRRIRSAGWTAEELITATGGYCVYLQGHSHFIC